MDFMKEAISQNEHWETGKINISRIDNNLILRDVFPYFEKEMKTKFIVILKGLRRTGKSVISKQILQKLILDGINSKKLCWFEFDRAMGASANDLDTLINFFKSRGGEYLVFDELAFVNGWQDIIKRHYDKSNIKFIITGSSALELDKRSAESLAGRFVLIEVKPFSFHEFLLLKRYLLPKTELDYIKLGDNLVVYCDEYIRVGGLPEAIIMKDSERKEYIKNSLLNPLFFKDIPAVFPSANPDLMLKTLELLSASIGSTFQYQTIAQVLGCTHPTISAQIDMLKHSLLAYLLFNYTGSLMKQKRTAKKINLGDNAIAFTLNPEITIGSLAENVVAETINAKYFWRDNKNREVDFIIPEDKLAIELKYQNTITKSDENNLKYFLDKHKGWKGILLTKNKEKLGEIEYIPLWKWLLSGAKTISKH